VLTMYEKNGDRGTEEQEISPLKYREIIHRWNLLSSDMLGRR